MGNEDPPNISLVPESDPWERERQQAKSELAWETREMAANLLRVIRGAGRPDYLPQQIINLGGAILETHKTARAGAIWTVMQETLNSAIPDWLEVSEAEACEGTIAKGALQYLASRLVHQRAQEAAGRREIHSGIRQLEREAERTRRKWQEEAASAEALVRAEKAARRHRRAKQKKPATKSKEQAKPTEEPREKPRSTAEFMKARSKEIRGED